MSYLNKLRDCENIHDLASILAKKKISVNDMSSTVFSQAASLSYARLAKKHKLFYSRYADDITFSTNQKLFLKEIATRLNEQSCEWKVSAELENLIVKSGFSIKDSKTRMQYKGSRQSVTGLVVNRGVNVRCEYYRYARSMCYSLFRKGEFFLPETKNKGSISQLEGILSHIHDIKDFSDLRENEKKKASPKSSTILYQDFLRYKCFFSLDIPLVVCEGKTDSIYLKCAIERLSANNNNLIETLNDKPVVIPLYFYTVLQTAICSASVAHVLKCTLRYGSRKSLFSLTV